MNSKKQQKIEKSRACDECQDFTRHVCQKAISAFKSLLRDENRKAFLNATVPLWNEGWGRFRALLQAGSKPIKNKPKKS